MVSIYCSNIGGEYEICLLIGCDFVLEGSKLGYDFGVMWVIIVCLCGSCLLEVDLSIYFILDVILCEFIKEGIVIVLENIFYDFNKLVI